MDILQALIEYQKKTNITQEALAHDLGVSFVSLNRWFNGHHAPSSLAKRQIESYLLKKNYKIVSS